MKHLAKWMHILLAVLIVIYIISGLGITQYRTMETLTFGLLTKPLAFKIHTALPIPFVILLIMHIYFSMIHKQKNKQQT